MTGTVFIALLAGHWIGDHWVQTDHQATGKGHHGWAGRTACAAHVATLTLCQMIALALVAATVGEGFSALQAALGLGINALTHYWADRRHTLQGLAAVLGKGSYYDRGGAPHLDQAWHMGWLLPAALIVTSPTAGSALLLSGISVAVLFGLAQLARVGRGLPHKRDGVYVILRNN